MLKEHFRCMPEIISFSNDLCCNGRLQPLRQYGADRLPPVRTVHVEDATAVGGNDRLVNTAEAEARADWPPTSRVLGFPRPLGLRAFADDYGSVR
jgi:hypothetical protein